MSSSCVVSASSLSSVSSSPSSSSSSSGSSSIYQHQQILFVISKYPAHSCFKITNFYITKVSRQLVHIAANFRLQYVVCTGFSSFNEQSSNPSNITNHVTSLYRVVTLQSSSNFLTFPGISHNAIKTTRGIQYTDRPTCTLTLLNSTQVTFISITTAVAQNR